MNIVLMSLIFATFAFVLIEYSVKKECQMSDKYLILLMDYTYDENDSRFCTRTYADTAKKANDIAFDWISEEPLNENRDAAVFPMKAIKN